MSSIKPDKAAVKAVIRGRQPWGRPEDLYQHFEPLVLDAIEGGTITPQRATGLLWHIGLRVELHFFPYSSIRNLLTYATHPDSWCLDLEHDLLVILTGLFTSDGDLRELLHEPLKSRPPLYADIFDTPLAPLSLQGKLCDFTGAFRNTPRRLLYERITQLGGTPSDEGWYTDYFFVAEDHVEKAAISNGLFSAIVQRMRYGHTRIFREHDFPLA